MKSQHNSSNELKRDFGNNSVFRKNYAAGGGRTLIADATSRPWTEAVSTRNLDMRTKVVRSRVVPVFGAAECAVTQIVQVAEFVPLE
jgi:hypothetical protein